MGAQEAIPQEAFLMLSRYGEYPAWEYQKSDRRFHGTVVLSDEEIQYISHLSRALREMQQF